MSCQLQWVRTIYHLILDKLNDGFFLLLFFFRSFAGYLFTFTRWYRLVFVCIFFFIWISLSLVFLSSVFHRFRWILFFFSLLELLLSCHHFQSRGNQNAECARPGYLHVWTSIMVTHVLHLTLQHQTKRQKHRSTFFTTYGRANKKDLKRNFEFGFEWAGEYS